jgi:hypothetical protein
VTVPVSFAVQVGVPMNRAPAAAVADAVTSEKMIAIISASLFISSLPR